MTITVTLLTDSLELSRYLMAMISWLLWTGIVNIAASLGEVDDDNDVSGLWIME